MEYFAIGLWHVVKLAPKK